ncbi:glycosyltransferase family 39 protein [Synechococcus sp. CBW1107]|uniref:ArnT family glycosyltransferase n=1 Tax=Synechococcus sp. CBW1107 TaxID=2789857 RepID=UPI002AD4E36D|nr:glycosyltransferase family 39 protein [Synechococcus sp. CBW1107]CAK6700360.1 Undecaprenyl phosphate-alpha-4-amino-4-deoxy-L-arabinose arabinosyl transferase [Synechococcus sp. CBW1107]
MLGLILVLGIALFVWQLGATGLVDETPPLFAASARAMAETGQWLIPHVNGLPRYDKPPLIYWLMGLGYGIPGQEQWNPLGTWAARLPSALAVIAVMLSLGYTLLRWPQSSGGLRSACTALGAALAFALSPLILLWGRIAVSDALLTGCLAVSLLLFWQGWAEPRRAVWPAWMVLGLAVLAKGPVALVLAGLTLLGFGLSQRRLGALWRRLRPLPGLALTALVALPWYLAALALEGEAFWTSFFGYHNVQRFTTVVNQHLQPWWYFAPVLLVAGLPFTPLLLLGLLRAMGRWWRRWSDPLLAQRASRPEPAGSLASYAACWLLAVLIFFTLAATKLPSYWLPATPAAGLLIALTAAEGGRASRWALGASVALMALLTLVLTLSPRWIPLINDPEMPTLPAELLASGLVLRAASCFALATLAGIWLCWKPMPRPWGLVPAQLPLVLFQLLAVLPMWSLGDGVRGLPVRTVAEQVLLARRGSEPLAMVGILKPSLHYYTRQVVLYEGISPTALVNLADRLEKEHRQGLSPSSPEAQPTVLVVIDQGTAQEPHWQGLAPDELGRSGLYRLWRLDRARLQRRAAQLRAGGLTPTWQRPVPERY